MQGYLGAVRTFGFNFAPQGMALCNGTLLSISQNNALFSLLGTFYGGDGVRTFALPNLQSRLPMSMGEGAGLSPQEIGEMSGVESQQLLSQNLPAHTHPFSGTASTLAVFDVRASAAQAAVGSQLARSIDANTAGTAIPQIYVPAGTAGTAVGLGGLNVAGINSVVGGTQPVSNLQPSLTLNFSIALQGVFPSRG